MQPSFLLNHRHALSVDEYTNIAWAVPIYLAQPHPIRAIESKMTQARIALWDEAASSPVADRVEDDGRCQATAFSRPASPSMTLATPSLSNCSSLQGSGVSSWSTPIGYCPPNIPGLSTDFLEQSIINTGDAQAFPSDRSGTPCNITEMYVMDCIQEVQSLSTLGRAVHAICRILSGETSKRRWKELAAKFRIKVIGLFGEVFSGSSGDQFLFDNSETYAAWHTQGSRMTCETQEQCDTIKALSICRIIAVLISMKVMNPNDLVLAVQILDMNRNALGHRSLIRALLRDGKNFTYSDWALRFLEGLGNSVGGEDGAISFDIAIHTWYYRMKDSVPRHMLLQMIKMIYVAV